MELASVAVTLKVKAPLTEGVPSIVQAGCTVIPLGTPEFATQVMGEVPLDVEMVCTEYAEP